MIRWIRTLRNVRPPSSSSSTALSSELESHKDTHQHNTGRFRLLTALFGIMLECILANLRQPPRKHALCFGCNLIDVRLRSWGQNKVDNKSVKCGRTNASYCFVAENKSLTCHREHFHHRGGAVGDALVSKLFLVDGQQVRDPVIQPHAQDELTGKQKNTHTKKNHNQTLKLNS